MECSTARLPGFVVGRFAEFGLSVEPADTVLVIDQPLILDCVANYTNDAGTHAASVQWLKDSEPFALSLPNKYGPLFMSLLG